MLATHSCTISEGSISFVPVACISPTRWLQIRDTFKSNVKQPPVKNARTQTGKGNTIAMQTSNKDEPLLISAVSGREQYRSQGLQSISGYESCLDSIPHRSASIHNQTCEGVAQPLAQSKEVFVFPRHGRISFCHLKDLEWKSSEKYGRRVQRARTRETGCEEHFIKIMSWLIHSTITL